MPSGFLGLPHSHPGPFTDREQFVISHQVFKGPLNENTRIRRVNVKRLIRGKHLQAEFPFQLLDLLQRLRQVPTKAVVIKDDQIRSEEHTSELQSLMSLSYAVFRLKKNN